VIWQYSTLQMPAYSAGQQLAYSSIQSVTSNTAMPCVVLILPTTIAVCAFFLLLLPLPPDD